MSANIPKGEKPGDVELTPAMYAAGLAELYRDRAFETDYEVLLRIFRAMARASGAYQPKK